MVVCYDNRFEVFQGYIEHVESFSSWTPLNLIDENVGRT